MTVRTSAAGAADWRKAEAFTGNYHAKMDTVQQLLLGAIDDIAIFGAARFSPVTLCARLKLPPSLVNYHFGSRMGLILDASVLAYERYVEGQEVALEQPTPELQLEYWITAQVEWTAKHSGIASVLNFPGLTGPTNDEFTLEHQARLGRSAMRNQQVIATIVGKLQGIIGDGELVDLEMAKRHPSITRAASLIGWMTLGHSVWKAGHHLPTNEVSEFRQITEDAAAFIYPTALLVARNPISVSHPVGAMRNKR